MLKIITLVSFAFLFVFAANGQNDIISKFKLNMENIKVVEYEATRIDTFSDGEVWKNTGYAHIERNLEDTLFGMSIMASRNDMDKLYIYNDNYGYEFVNMDKRYTVGKNPIGFLGRPGGQMVNLNFFELDSVYEDLQITTDDKHYILDYKLADDIKYDYLDIHKVVYIDKDDLLVSKIRNSAVSGGESTSTHLSFKNVKINGERKLNRVLKENLERYTIRTLTAPDTKSIIGRTLEEIEGVNISNGENSTIKTDKPTLVDFWEVWCSPCIASFPKLNELERTFENRIEIIGLITDNAQQASKLLNLNEVTYRNFLIDSKYHKLYMVNSFPRYLLTDKNGVIVRVYHGFSDEIKDDIEVLL